MTAAEAPGKAPQAPDTSWRGQDLGAKMRQPRLYTLCSVLLTIPFLWVRTNLMRCFKKPVLGKVTTSTDFTNFSLILCLISYTFRNTSYSFIVGNTTLPASHRSLKLKPAHTRRRVPEVTTALQTWSQSRKGPTCQGLTVRITRTDGNCA